MAMGRRKARLNLTRIAVGSKEGARKGFDLDAGPLPSAGVAHATGEGSQLMRCLCPGAPAWRVGLFLALLWFDAAGWGLGLRGAARQPRAPFAS